MRVEPFNFSLPEPVFQGLWATLHLTACLMHFGSFVYHLRRVS